MGRDYPSLIPFGSYPHRPGLDAGRQERGGGRRWKEVEGGRRGWKEMEGDGRRWKEVGMIGVDSRDGHGGRRNAAMCECHTQPVNGFSLGKMGNE